MTNVKYEMSINERNDYIEMEIYSVMSGKCQYLENQLIFRNMWMRMK